MTPSSHFEQYPSAPLRFVTFEVQHSRVPGFATEEGHAAIFERLRDHFPVADTQQRVQVAVTPDGLASPASSTTELVMVNRDRTRSVTASPTAFGVQSSTFTDWPELRSVIEIAIRAIGESGITAVRRVGLRYIDEIRIEGVSGPDQWHQYIQDFLLAPQALAEGHRVEAQDGILGVRIDEDVLATIRFGAHSGYAVDPNGRLRLPPIEDPGPYFLLDLDCSWQEDNGEMRAFDPDDLLNLSDALNAPAHYLFEKAITEDAREAFRRIPS
ncbi:MAG TPA: TIGR04255 family protein [Conexibacter sp.]|nr:TIGR04255 family protein [Conexibacter sp.]